jgi:hypothetical protein
MSGRPTGVPLLFVHHFTATAQPTALPLQGS